MNIQKKKIPLIYEKDLFSSSSKLKEYFLYHRKFYKNIFGLEHNF